MSVPDLEVTDEPADVWHVGRSPDPWGWAPWKYAGDAGRFNGRWDDELGEFRTIYTADSLLGCFLELLAHFRPSTPVLAALDEIEDDDGTIAAFGEAGVGVVGYSWLDGREYGSASQTGRYCFITHSRTVAALQRHYPFGRHGIAAIDVDAALLKDAHDRVLTRSIARWVYDLRDDDRREVVDGIEFRSRHGDDIHVWAIFERSRDDSRSHHLNTTSEPEPVTDALPELVEAMRRFGLSW
ncbi:RES domain-containing protein [Agromyces larvae]|uniref:RES domain-containing protein n=1 Tax=Agromyces larvae TaxID=2929802 RepID=A0ABY4C319_9MICO|nr:RES domain-containing protein [Agromyces larvae]UOE43165.1 RES domain-containing protein [Agromyces larvae]